MDNNAKGQIAQLKVETRATEKGWIVSRTQEGARYDLILDDGKRLYRVQVKWAGAEDNRFCGGAVEIDLRKNQGDDRNKKYRRSKMKIYSSDEIDAIVGYIPQIDKCVWFGAEVFDQQSHIRVRFEQPKNGQKKGIRMVDDFLW
jgi:hypothetical protein